VALKAAPETGPLGAPMSSAPVILPGGWRRPLKIAGEDNHSEIHRVGREARIRTLQRAIGERARRLGFAIPNKT